MKVLVTGGTGRIGANLSVNLLAKGHDVRCFVYPGDASRAGKLAAYDRVEVVEWVGEELCMTYHHQYGVPATVLRFATVIEPSELLNEDGLPARFLFGPTYERYKDVTSDDPEEQEILRELRSLWTGEERLLLSRNPNGRPYKQEFADVRDIVQGLTLALEKNAAVGEEFTLGGAALFRWEEVVPYFSERYGIEYVDARLPESNYFEFDLSKIKTLLGYGPKHDVPSVLETAEAMRRGEETDVIPTGIRYDGRA